MLPYHPMPNKRLGEGVVVPCSEIAAWRKPLPNLPASAGSSPSPRWERDGVRGPLCAKADLCCVVSRFI